MLVVNFFQINKWKCETLLTVVISTLLILWGTIGLDYIGFQIPLLRPIISLFFLLLIPGILLIRILKLNELDNIEVFLYAIGLSLSFLMFSGYALNYFSLILNLYKPFSLISLMIILSVLTLLLCYLCYATDDKIPCIYTFNINKLISVSSLYLFMLPFLTIIGVYIRNFSHDNKFLMFTILLLALTFVLIGFSSFISEELYPLVAFVISISLLFHISLVSMYLVGWDIQFEHYISSLVVDNFVWDSTISSGVNAMLSVSILPPILSIISNLELIWIFKIVYPLIFSFVPIGLYKIFEKQTSPKVALLSVFFFVSVFVYYAEMVALAKQQIAEFYFVLILFLSFNTTIDKAKKPLLLIIFLFSLCVSHYGLSYIFLGSIVLTAILITVLSHYVPTMNKNIKYLTKNNFFLLYFVFSISWYILVSNSSSFNALVSFSNHIVITFITDFLNPNSVQGLNIVIRSTVSSLHLLGKYLHLSTIFFISFGLFFCLSKLFNIYPFERIPITLFKGKGEFLIFSITFYFVLLAALTIPNFASTFNTSRLYQISLFFLAPYGVIGGLITFTMILKSRIFGAKDPTELSLKTLFVFFAIFLLFNSGWVYELAKDNPISISLSSVDSPVFNEQEVLGCKWICSARVNNHFVYADYYNSLLLNSILGRQPVLLFPKDSIFSPASYFYFGTSNIFKKEFTLSHNPKYALKNINVCFGNRIYNNGGSQIYIN